MKWCEERNLNTGASCENGVPWTDFSYENCNYFTFIVIGIGIGIVIIASVVVEVWVCCLRRTSHATIGTERTSPADTPDNLAVAYYQTLPTNHETHPSYCSAHALLLKRTDSSSSLEYAQWQDSNHKETSSNPRTEAASSNIYAEPYRHTTDASGTYAVPYHHTTDKTGESKISDENVFCAESDNAVYSEGISVRNSLYSQF
jgi:hypothetical protein